MLLKETLDKVYIYLDIYGKPMYDKVCVVSILNLVDLLILYFPWSTFNVLNCFPKKENLD